MSQPSDSSPGDHGQCEVSERRLFVVAPDTLTDPGRIPHAVSLRLSVKHGAADRTGSCILYISRYHFFSARPQGS